MYFKIKKNELNFALQHVNKAVSTKTTIPILTGIKFEIKENGLYLTGSDSDISIQIIIPIEKNDEQIIEVNEIGNIVLPKYIVDIVRKLPEDEIEFKKIDSLTISIKSGTSEFKLNGYDAEEYPELVMFNENQIFSIQSELLKTMIKQTIFAVSTLESRPVLTGVLWQSKNNTLKFVATDSHRLAVREAMIESETEININNIVVPGKSLQELSKILEDEDLLVDIVITENQIIFKISNILFISRLLDGTYPDISKIIPDNNITSMTLNTKNILDAIERASLLVRDSKTNTVKLSITDNTELEISSNIPEVGKVNENIKIIDFQGEPIKISFNAKYTIDALKAIDNHETVINFTGSLSPFIIKPTGNDKILYLILPVRTY